MTRFPCPNCGAKRARNDSPCAQCRFPKHSRDAVEPAHRRGDEARNSQFHIGGIMKATAVAAVFATAYASYGTEGLWFAARISSLGVFYYLGKYARC